VRSELSLVAHTATVTFAPGVKPSPSAPAGTLVAQLDTNGSLRVGTLALGRDDPKGTRYELRLEETGEGWQLQIGESASAAPIGRVALASQTASAVSPTFVAALMPSTRNSGRLILRWGSYEATTDVQFTDPPRRRQTERTPANVTVNRAHDEDTSALSRARLLAQRNETALSLPSGRRLSASYARQGLDVSGPDFSALASTRDGAVVQLTESAIPRLRIETALQFGRIAVRTGNHGPNFPGSYGMWLKRAGTGWRLVLNHEADVWGSQHDPKLDAAEIPLTHTEGHLATRPFAVALVPTGADRGRLLILWGPHEWAADFVVS
jgi:hypothetical protein